MTATLVQLRSMIEKLDPTKPTYFLEGELGRILETVKVHYSKMVDTETGLLDAERSNSAEAHAEELKVADDLAHELTVLDRQIFEIGVILMQAVEQRDIGAAELGGLMETLGDRAKRLNLRGFAKPDRVLKTELFEPLGRMPSDGIANLTREMQARWATLKSFKAVLTPDYMRLTPKQMKDALASERNEGAIRAMKVVEGL